MMKKFKLLMGMALALVAQQSNAQVEGVTKFPNPDLYKYVKMETKHGDVVLRLYPDVAPQTVQAFLDRVNEGFYNGVYFHRVIPGFVAQGGDPTLVGRPAANYTLPAEFSKLKHKRGTLAMARVGHDIHSASTQFYISYGSHPHLDGQYTIFGEVETGMSAVDQINKGDKMIKLYQVNKTR
ncbi:MAG: peptidylprolyl isomerase [Magnetococcales bacterium]|nr:peptidylprolyl isomerase [Magnetococcales bacterium]|tara:strand:+ start:6800 stop:7342 length:543 start_codon:yes stop_codon:yes gene_type:complete